MEDSTKLHVVAVEFSINQKIVDACIVKNGNIYIYNASYGELIPVGRGLKYFDTLRYVIIEGKYIWTNFYITEGQQISSIDSNILVDGESIDHFPKEITKCNIKVSDIFLDLFVEYLIVENKRNTELVDGLNSSYRDGLFRASIEEIIEEDSVDELSFQDQEMILRYHYEGNEYVIRYVRSIIQSDQVDSSLLINHFFRRLFNLEKSGYIKVP